MTILHGKLEDLQALPIEKVDVIVSEWMGYALLFETMLDSVLCARDRFLKPGGAIMPDIAYIYLAGASSGATGSLFWKVKIDLIVHTQHLSRRKSSNHDHISLVFD